MNQITTSEIDRKSKPLADKIFSSILERQSPYEVRLAQTYQELRSAYSLVYQEYLVRGYCRKKRSKMNLSYFCVLPGSRTFILLETQTHRICGTASLIVDSPSGLPMESSFDEPLRRVRSEERRIAEVTLLAVVADVGGNDPDPLMSFGKLITVLSFFREILNYARFRGITDLVITVNPKHETTYRSFGFKPIGPELPYEKVCGSPAVPMHLDIVAFCDVKFRGEAVQKYFLKELCLDSFHREPAHWDSGVREKLVRRIHFSHPETLSIFQSYLRACYAVQKSNGKDSE